MTMTQHQLSCGTIVAQSDKIDELSGESALLRAEIIASLPYCSDKQFEEIVSQFNAQGTTPKELNSVETDEDGEPIGYRLTIRQGKALKKARQNRKKWLATAQGREQVNSLTAELTVTACTISPKGDGSPRVKVTYE